MFTDMTKNKNNKQIIHFDDLANLSQQDIDQVTRYIKKKETKS